MLKEFCYQKVMCPIADALLTGERTRDVVHGLYRRIHPRRDGGCGDGDAPSA